MSNRTDMPTLGQHLTGEEAQAWHPTHPGGSLDSIPWFCEHALAKIPEGGVYLEVGVFFGRLLSFVGLMRPDIRLIAVDQWVDEWDDAGERLPVGPDRELRDKHGGMFNAFLAMLKQHAPEILDDMAVVDDLPEDVDASGAEFDARGTPRLTVVRAPSQRAFRIFPDAATAVRDIDFVFLDGDHTYSGLMADIEEGQRIVKPGGILAGHDFTCVAWGGDVQRAVRDALLFKVGGKGYDLAPWPVEREGWENGSSSVWIAKGT